MAGAGIYAVITEMDAANPVPSLLFTASASRMEQDELTSAGRAYQPEPLVANPAAGGVPIQIMRMGAAAMDAPLSLQSVVVAASEQVSCPLGEESAILNLKNSVYYGMNPVGARVWDMLKQPKSVREMRDILLQEYEVEEDRCHNDLLALLETMRSEGLIVVCEAATRD
jgi:hypothetical protein